MINKTPPLRVLKTKKKEVFFCVITIYNNNNMIYFLF
jgi:hypothetical protein